MTNSDESAIDEHLSDNIPPEISDLPENQSELLADLSGTDGMFYYENGHNSAVFISIGIHCLLLLLLIYTWKTTFMGAAEDQTAQGGIVLVNNSSESPTYHQNPSEQNTDNTSQAAASISELLEQNLEADTLSNLDLPGGLPDESAQPLIETNGSSESALPSLEELTNNKTSTGGDYGKVETGVFGIKGKGSRFIYVFDRSASMSGYQGRPIQAAKQQLLASLTDLKENHQFQIIFYNEYPSIFNPFHPSPAKLLYGNPINQKQAFNFVEDIKPAGQTNHIGALKIALNMKPDVIFFLTDADEPQLTTNELAFITSRNDSIGASINCIQFGVGKYLGAKNFLMRLADLNGGQYNYVDLNKLRTMR
ncbi:MAG: hypothetical protein CMJ76_04515 [Planctomycetaceae bacterium]|nr:hypothetical protein [Planctomycetaceae bacterium]